jgi:hypothetical protein
MPSLVLLEVQVGVEPTRYAGCSCARSRFATAPFRHHSPIPRNALAGGSAPLDLIGHAAHRFDSARRLDPGVVRAILESELPTAFTALERMP